MHLQQRLREVNSGTVTSSAQSVFEEIQKPLNIRYSAKEITNLRFQLAEKNKQCDNLKRELEEKSFENTSLEERLVQKEIYINNLLQELVKCKHSQNDPNPTNKYSYEKPVDFVKSKMGALESLYSEMQSSGNKLQCALKCIRQELLFTSKRGMLSASVDDLSLIHI